MNNFTFSQTFVLRTKVCENVKNVKLFIINFHARKRGHRYGVLSFSIDQFRLSGLVLDFHNHGQDHRTAVGFFVEELTQRMFDLIFDK